MRLRSSSLIACSVAALAVSCDPPPNDIEPNDDGEGEGDVVAEGEGEGDVVAGEGEGEVEVFDCAHPNPDFNAAVGLGRGWSVVEQLPLPASMRTVDRAAADGGGRVIGFLAQDGLLEDFGAWPDLAPSGEPKDVVLAEHRGPTFVLAGRSLVVDEADIIFTYAVSANGTVEGGLYDDAAGTTTLVHNPFSARRIGDRLIVSAAGLLGQGSTTIDAPVVGFAVERAAPDTAIALIGFNETYSDLVRFSFLDDDNALISRLSGPGTGFSEDARSSTHLISTATLATATLTAVIAPAAEGAFAGDVTDAFDVDLAGQRGVMVLEGSRGVDDLTLLTDDGAGGLAAEVALDLDPACTAVRFAFALAGEPVVALIGGDGETTLLHLQRD